jgi:hypothetical protein
MQKGLSLLHPLHVRAKGDGSMKKKIAVLVRGGKSEALRMAVGLTLADDEVTVFVVDSKLDPEDEAVSLNVETLNDLAIS